MINKKLINTGEAAPAPFDPLQNFETVTYTGNGGTQKITGYIRKGAAFNGSAYITTTPQTQQQEFSWSFWVNYTSTSLYSFIASVYTGSDVSGVPNALFINSQNSGRLALALGNNGSYIFNFNHTTTGLNDGNWHHVLVSWDGTTNTDAVKFYIDNVVTTATSSISAASLPNYSEFALGARAVDHIIPYTGSIDQVRIFNKALSQSEVDTLEAETYADPKKSTTDYFGDGSGVALYELDEDANDTGGTVNGYIDGAADFSGAVTSYIKVDTSPLNGFLANSTYSVSLWFNADSFSTQFPTLIAGLTGTNSLPPYIWCDASKIRFHGYQYGDYNATINTNQWYHVVMVNNGTSTFAYVNGSPVTLSGLTTFGPNAGDSLVMGGLGTTSAVTFDGKIDQVRIYSSALSSQDVTNLYNESSVPTANLVAHYKLDGDANDETGSYNGTATNVSWGYDGTPTNVNFLGMAFQPDFVWIKDRDGTDNHVLQDSIRGVNSVLFSNLTNAVSADTDNITSFNSNGFSIGTSTRINASSEDHVAWCWKAGGAASLNENGSIDSQVSANQDAGFSIAKYTSTSGGNHSVGHGLGEIPEMVIVKRVDTTGEWYVFYNVVDGSWDYMTLNTPNAKADFDTFNATNNTTFYAGPAGSGETYINYCFHSVDGYQKVGTYTGSTSAVSVTTGFQPRFVLVKNSTTSPSNWTLWDDIRGGSVFLQPNNSGTEASGRTLTFNLDGFTINTDAGVNGNSNGDTYIYLAIA